MPGCPDVLLLRCMEYVVSVVNYLRRLKMKNEKIVKVCEIVIQICNTAVIIAQAIKSAFPALAKKSGNVNFTQEDAKLIKEFLASEKLDD